MYAVIRTGGKQYRVAQGEVFRFEKLAGEPGAAVVFGDVLMIGGSGKDPQVGRPTVAGATVEGKILDQGKGSKIVVFKKKRRKGYQRKQGHRQLYTEVKIEKISA